MVGRRLCVATACLALAVAVPAVEGAPAPAPPQWRPLTPVQGIVDVAGPRRDGRLVLATRSGLLLLRPGSPPQPFARGPGGYTAAGGEPYLALGTGIRPSGADCTFRRERDLRARRERPAGHRPDRPARTGRPPGGLPGRLVPSGIAFDIVGRFGYRLLVTVVVAEKTTLYAIDCRGRATVVSQGGPRVEGGIAVAPRSFSRFAGELIAPDELSGRLFAFGPQGRVRLVVESGLPAGGDIGVEGVGFVPAGLGRRGAAYFAGPGRSRLADGRQRQPARPPRPGSRPCPGLYPGELVAATESGALTIAVRCATRCTVRRVAVGPATAHGEGHVAFVPEG